MRKGLIIVVAATLVAFAGAAEANDRSPAGSRDRAERGGGAEVDRNRGAPKPGERARGGHDARAGTPTPADRERGGPVDRGGNNPGPGMADHDPERHAEGHPEENDD